ncbi:acyltransferase family protein [Aquamicrobium segne]|uniref:Acyltransferase family protein n=1 Tax=Aquamicrobium segne TaxID=469547 RepID=A0ABW0GUG3_9HYPH
MKRQGQLFSLQQGRGIAAMAVVLFHLSIMLALPRYLGQELFSDYTWRGNLGVDFFFVLSGFIIVFAHNHDIDRPDRLRNYLGRRFIRLFPVYWVYVGVFCTLVALGFGSGATIPETWDQWISTIFLVRLDKFTFPIAPAWTLVHELAFYLMFSLLIANKRWGIIIFSMWMVACFMVREYPEFEDMTPWTAYFSPLNLNFLVGMLAYLGWKHGRQNIVKWAFPAGLLLLATLYALESKGAAYAHVQLGYAVAFGLAITGAATLETARQWPSKLAVLNLIGDASYSIYLTHIAVLGLLAKILIKISEYAPMPAELIFLLVFIGTIICGCLAHLIVERPLISMLRLHFSAKQPIIDQRSHGAFKS